MLVHSSTCTHIELYMPLGLGTSGRSGTSAFCCTVGSQSAETQSVQVCSGFQGHVAYRLLKVLRTLWHSSRDPLFMYYLLLIQRTLHLT